MLLRHIGRHGHVAYRNVAAELAWFSRQLATRSNDTNTEDDLRSARQWLSTFNVETIPRNICEISFSRASGPGGQNVNKYYSRQICVNLPPR